MDFYPGSLFLDNSAKVWRKREKLYNSLRKMTIVTPSKYLADLVKISMFKENHPIKVINNGINLNIFRPVESNFRKEHNLENFYMILAVAYFWDECKGLYTLIDLAKRLPNEYRIVMVGTNDETDKILPDNIVSIHKTYNQEELVKIYSCADLFINATTDDNFPTVNMEALACGTPVLTYDTGGSAEIIDETCGSSVLMKDIDGLEKEIIRICKDKPYSRQACLEHAKKYDTRDKYQEYINLYKKILN